MTIQRSLVCVAVILAAYLLCRGAGSGAAPPRREPPKLVLEGKRTLDIRVCEVEDDGGITMIDESDHFMLSGGTLTNMIANGYGVTRDRVRGINDDQDIHVGVELAGELPGPSRMRLMADAAAAFAGCRASLKKEPGQVLTLSFGTTKPPASAGGHGVRIGERSIQATAMSLEGFASSLCSASGMYFVAKTSAKESGAYDFNLQLPAGINWTDPAAITAIQEQTGLVITREQGEVPYVSVTWNH
jgi:hypothetical protein